MLPKIDQLRSLLTSSNVSVLGITETKLDIILNNEEVEIDGYNLFRSDGNRKGGGTTCYIKTNIRINCHGKASVKNLKTF